MKPDIYERLGLYKNDRLFWLMTAVAATLWFWLGFELYDNGVCK